MLNNESKRELTPDELEAARKLRDAAQEKAGEVLREMEKQSTQPGRPYKPNQPSEKHIEQGPEILRQPVVESKPEQANPDDDEDDLDHELRRKDPLGWINATISNKGLSPNKITEGLIDLHEQDNPDKPAQT
jgi:hypothetical protein